MMVMKYEIAEQYQLGGVLTVSDYRLGNQRVQVDFIFRDNLLLGYSFSTDKKTSFADAQKSARLFAEKLKESLGEPEVFFSPREQEVKSKKFVLYRRWRQNDYKVDIYLQRLNSRYLTVVQVH